MRSSTVWLAKLVFAVRVMMTQQTKVVRQLLDLNLDDVLRVLIQWLLVTRTRNLTHLSRHHQHYQQKMASKLSNNVADQLRNESGPKVDKQVKDGRF